LDLDGARYFVGEGFVAWQSRTVVTGFCTWGRPGPDAAALLVRLLETAERRPHCSLVDVRGLTGVDYAAFDVFFRGIRGRQAKFASSITKQAVLRPEGPVGAVVLGFYGLMSVRYPVEHFTALEDAVAWFETGEPDVVLAEITGLLTAVHGVPDIVARLRATWAFRVGTCDPAAIARELGLSRRTLQRRLELAGTTLRDEVNHHRVERVKALLLDSDAPMEAIADQVGFESVRTLNDAFRRRTGSTPTAFRRGREGDPRRS